MISRPLTPSGISAMALRLSSCSSQTGYEADAVAAIQQIETTLAAAQGPVALITLNVVTTARLHHR
jgi:hypothetical protein